jgi:hypothetical protein
MATPMSRDSQHQTWRIRLAIALDMADRMHAPDDLRRSLVQAFNLLEEDESQGETAAQRALDAWHDWSSRKK